MSKASVPRNSLSAGSPRFGANLFRVEKETLPEVLKSLFKKQTQYAIWDNANLVTVSEGKPNSELILCGLFLCC